MELRSLLLSQDSEMIDVLQTALGDLGIGVELYSSSSWALEDVRQHKFDAVIVDCDTAGGTEFLNSVRNSPSNSRSLTFAIVSSDIGLPVAFQMGANLALQKPISVDTARSSLRAAYGLIMQERRRYFRYPVDLPVQVCPDEETILNAIAINVSEGGMALKCERELQANSLVRLSFYLPGTNSGMELGATVVWKDPLGRAGVRFESPSVTTRHRLNEWLESQMAVY
jgi:CheY-like chemotaxis protein